MEEIFRLSSFMVQLFGPLMVACLVLMYISARRVRRSLSPREVMYAYIKYNIETRRHAGILTYLFIVSLLFFILSALGLLAGYLLK